MDQRFSQITDRLFHKGYNLYPYSEEQHIQTEPFSSLIRGTHQRTAQQEYYLIVIPQRNLADHEIQALRALENQYLRVYEIESDYIAYHYVPRLNPTYVDHVICECIASARQSSSHETQQKMFSTPSTRKTAQMMAVQGLTSSFQKMFSTPSTRKTTQMMAVQGLTSSFNMVRFREITDKVARKGYSLYPYSRHREIEMGRQVAVILATHERTQHQENYLVAIPHQNLEGMVLHSIRNVCFKNVIKRLYDLDQEYLVFYLHPLLTIPNIDEMIEEFRKHYAAQIQLAGERRPHSESIIYPMNETVQKNPDGSEVQKPVPRTIMRRLSSVSSQELDVHNLEGHTVDGFKVRQKLGEGGFGLVYLTEHGGSFSVMKIAKSDRGSESIIVERKYLQEFNKLFTMPDYRDFPKCVPKIYAAGEFQGMSYFVEEFILTLDTLKNVIYKSSRVSKFNATALIKDYYQDKSERAANLNEREKYLEMVSSVDRTLTGQFQAIPIDPLIVSHIALQLMYLVYVINAYNYHYGDLKSENVGLRLEDMDIIRKDQITPKTKFEFAIKDNIIARQLEIQPESPPPFCAVLLDFGSLTPYKREDDSAVFFTPKYMVPNELVLRHGMIKKSFIKDPYTLGLVFFSMITGLPPFWHVKLSGGTDQQVAMINALYEAGETPFDLDLVKTILDLNMGDICRDGKSDSSLTEVIIEAVSMLMKGVFKDEIIPIITNLRKKLMRYYHRDPSRYQPLKRFSEHDEVLLSQKKGLRR